MIICNTIFFVKHNVSILMYFLRLWKRIHANNSKGPLGMKEWSCRIIVQIFLLYPKV